VSNSPNNPYAPTALPTDNDSSQIDPVLLAKINAIIKDAGQFWIAILLCILCSALGSVIIGIWYAVRLMQWNAIANSQPLIMAPNPAPGSIAAKFQGAKVKLIVGVVFGVCIFALMIAYVVFMVLVIPTLPNR
jgi:hypothetical protein